MICDLFAGFFAGFVSVMCNNPFDVVKTNMQSLDAKKYGGITNTFLYIWRHEGFLGYYKGVGPRLARVCLDGAITFSVFHQIQRSLVNLLSR